MNTNNFYWPEDIWSLHVEVQNNSNTQQRVEYARILNNTFKAIKIEKSFLLKPNEYFRFVISRNALEEIGVCLNFEENLYIRVFKLLDRAHFPTDAVMYYKGNGTNEDISNKYVK